MYDDKITKSVVDQINTKVITTVSTCIALAEQGYIANKSKITRIDWSTILLHAFENINILSDEQKHNVELVYNKLSTI